MRKRLLWIGAGGIALLLALWVFFKDEALRDHSDLAPVAPKIEDGEATFEAWIAAAEKADEAPWDAVGGLPAFHDSLSGAAPWDSAKVARILTPNRSSLDKAIGADALGAFIMPQMRRIDDPVPYLGKIQLMARNLKLLALERAHEGDFDAARDAVLIGLRLGDRAVEGNGSLIGFLVGITLEAISYSAIDQIARGPAPDEVLAALATALGEEPDFAAAYQHSLRIEFSMLADSLGRMHELGMADMLDGDAPPAFLLKRNRTINEAAELHYRPLVANAALLPSKRITLAFPKPPEGLGRFGGNAFGRCLNAMGPPVFESILQKSDHNLAQRRATRTRIALLRYEKAEGKLPPALSALVPGYLDAVPADPFDGKPMRYDAARGALWVIGSDLSDGGGATSVDPKGRFDRMSDPTVFVHDPPPAVP